MDSYKVSDDYKDECWSHSAIQKRSRVIVHRVAAQVGIQLVSTHRMTRYSHPMFPCRILIRQLINCAEIDARETSANAMLQHLDASKIDVQHLVLLWIDFPMDGFVSNQKWCIWWTENIHIAVPLSLHSQKSWLGKHEISDIGWPACSPYLTPCDFLSSRDDLKE